MGDPSPTNGRRSIRPYVPVTLLTPVLGSVLGLDGGAIFQIFATENLGLSSASLGIAFGLGVVSVPVQVWAARMPLWRARRNLQICLAVGALQAGVLALLMVTGTTGRVAMVALAVTVTAEISISVLFATAWQPLLSYALPSVDRQQINSRVRAVGGGLLAASLLVFAALSQTWRAVFVVVVGLFALWSAVGLRRLPAPEPPAPGGTAAGPAPPRPPSAGGLRLVYIALALVNAGSLPLLLVYVHSVIWPAANLGLVGAVQLAGTLAAWLSWRPTAAGVVRRARAAALALTVSGVFLAALNAPVTHRSAQLALLAAVAVAAGAATTIRLALLELAHRFIDDASSVRAFTVLDVVASTSLQLGLLVAGLLVAVSSSAQDWLVDPYRAFVLVFAVATVAVTSRLRSEAGSAPTDS